MSRDFWRSLDRVEVEKIRNPLAGAPRVPSIRLYCTASPRTFGDEAQWSLQLRGPVKLASGGHSRDLGIATGSLSLSDLIALRDEADAVIRGAQADRARVTQDPPAASPIHGVGKPHPFSPSRYADICGSCGGRASDGVHKLSYDEISSRTKTRDLRRPGRTKKT